MGLDILLVDDEEDFALALAERLTLRGFTLHVAHDGEQALRVAENCPARIMVLDLKMPGMGGMEVLRRLKKNRPEIQVIILSGHGSEADEAMARFLGACEYLKKPADICDILKALKKAEQEMGAQALSTESL
jgi:two-component system, OmpR family, response regulator CpxR